MWDRVTFKNRAKAIMKEHYWKVFIACILASLLGATGSGGGIEFEYDSNSGGMINLDAGLFNFDIPVDYLSLALGFMLVSVVSVAIIAGIVLSTFVINILRVGFCRYLVLTQQYGRPAEIGEIFWGFSCGHYMNLVKAMFFHDLYIFLWMLLFIIPGIVKAYEYTCVPYILAEHPEMDYREVLDRSVAMTDGHKFDIFVLALSFFGWNLLGTLLFGIGTLFVIPYIQLTNGEMYAFLRSRIEPDPYNGGYGSQDYTQDYTQGYTY